MTEQIVGAEEKPCRWFARVCRGTVSLPSRKRIVCDPHGTFLRRRCNLSDILFPYNVCGNGCSVGTRRRRDLATETFSKILFDIVAGVGSVNVPLRPPRTSGGRMSVRDWVGWKKFWLTTCTGKKLAVLLQPLWKQGEQKEQLAGVSAWVHRGLMRPG